MVSIIVPCYKSAKYLSRCVKSLIGQTYSDIEVILIDDGSPDDTGELCDKLAQYDTRIKVLHKINEGVSASRNAGISVSKGKYICFVDSDDWVSDDYVSSLVAAMEDNMADMVISGRVIHKLSGEIEEYRPVKKRLLNDSVREFFFEPSYKLVRGGPVGKLYKSSIIKKSNIQFPTDIHYLEDAVFVLEYLLMCDAICSIPNLTYHYELHPCSLVFTVHDFKTEGRGYRRFKSCMDKCIDVYMLRGKERKWLIDNVLFLIERQIKAAGKDMVLLNRIDWPFYRENAYTDSFRGRIYKYLLCSKFCRPIMAKLNLVI